VALLAVALPAAASLEPELAALSLRFFSLAEPEAVQQASREQLEQQPAVSRAWVALLAEQQLAKPRAQQVWLVQRARQPAEWPQAARRQAALAQPAAVPAFSPVASEEPFLARGRMRPAASLVFCDRMPLLPVVA
jgi:hypothetical protein